MRGVAAGNLVAADAKVDGQDEGQAGTRRTGAEDRDSEVKGVLKKARTKERVGAVAKDGKLEKKKRMKEKRERETMAKGKPDR